MSKLSRKLKAMAILYKYKRYKKLQDNVDKKHRPLNTEKNIYINNHYEVMEREYKQLTGKDIDKVKEG